MVPPDTQGAEKSLRKALRLDPNLVIARNWLAGVLQRQGLEDEGFLELRRAVAIDPLAPVVNANLASDEAATGNFRQAEQRLLRLLQVPKPSHMTFLSLRELYLNMGRLVDLNRMARLSALARARETGRPWHVHLAKSYALLGMWRESDFWFEQLEASDPNGIWEQSARLDLLARRGHFNEVSSIADAFLNSKDFSAEKITLHENVWLGMFLALAGNYEEAVRRLNAAIDIHSSSHDGPGNRDLADAILSLAWASLQTGEKDRAQTIIRIMQDKYSSAQKLGRLHLSSDLAGFALTAQLAGNSKLALERMQSAVNAGWRDYYLFRHDPRWASVRDEPGFVELMAFVKENIDRQRTEQEGIDASEDFEAQLASAMADHASRSADILR
jgi:tetratricopeptide (TPR) repeat protein